MKEIALYIHVPFCEKKCRYCDFFSVVGKKGADTVIRETLLQAVYYSAQYDASRFPTVFLGGGTPSLLSFDQTRALLAGLQSVAPDPQEFSIEVNPESLTSEKLQLYGDFGVNRVSVGLQTFSQRHFDILGRIGSPSANIKALDLLAREWQGSISVDLITGLPDQTAQEADEDLRRVLDFAPHHISLYTLVVERGTPLYDDIDAGRIQQPQPEAVEDLWIGLAGKLHGAGYEHYEISNFALPGRQCRHNLAYWNMMPYLGCGPAAVSTLPGRDGAVRISNPPSLPDYLAGRKARWNAAVEPLSSRELFIEHLMMGLRLKSGILLARMEQIFGVDILDLIPATTRKWIDSGRLLTAKGVLRLSDEGRFLLNAFIGDAMSELPDDQPSRSSWP